MALDLNELQKLLDSAQTASNNDKEIRKSLVRVDNLIGNIQKEMEHIYSLLDGTATAKGRKVSAPREVDADAPYGRKKDGTPKQRPGRTKVEA